MLCPVHEEYVYVYVCVCARNGKRPLLNERDGFVVIDGIDARSTHAYMSLADISIADCEDIGEKTRASLIVCRRWSRLCCARWR